MAFGGVEWLVVIVAIVLLLFGAKKIPEFARNLGKAKMEFRRGELLVEREMKEEERIARERETKAGAETERNSKDTDLQKAARDLGIDPAGKTDAELKELIKEKVSSP